MTEAAGDVTLQPLPARLARVFRLLRSGRHLSRDDGADFLDLDRHHAQYAHILSGLGYELQHHSQGFYYVEGKGSVRSNRLRGALLFLFILFQDLDEKKFQTDDRSWERSVLRRTFRIAEMPHFQTAQRRAMMSAVGVDEEHLIRVLQLLERLGVVRMLPEKQFEFLAPVYRFIDLCIHYAEDEKWSERAVPTAHDPDGEARSEVEANL